MAKPERLTGQDLHDAIETTRYYPDPVSAQDYACHMLGLPEGTDLTDAQITEAALIAMGYMFTGGEKIT